MALVACREQLAYALGNISLKSSSCPLCEYQILTGNEVPTILIEGEPPSRSCVRTKTEKHTEPTSGPMPRRYMKGSMPSFTTLPQAGQALMPAPSWLTGKASSSPMTTAVTNKASSKPG